MACGTVTQGGGHARGVKKDKQRSDRRRNAVHLWAELFGRAVVGFYRLSWLLWLCCRFPQLLDKRVQHRHVLIPFGQLGLCVKRSLNNPLYLSVVAHAAPLQVSGKIGSHLGGVRLTNGSSKIG
jgi:hypothetical protein